MPDDIPYPDLFASRDEITGDDIAAFNSALDGARDELDMQRCLEGHPRILIQHLPEGRGACVIPQKRLGSEHVTDFVIGQKASDGIVWYAVELERPQAKMFNKNGDPSAALNHALRQVSDWREWISQNRDYAARPVERSGLGLIDIDPELEGLIIIGRDAEVDKRATASRRRRLERVNRVRIEIYDWLLSQTRERLEGFDKRARAIAAVVNAPESPLEWLTASLKSRPEEPAAEKAVNEVFGGRSHGWADASVVRGEIEWEGVELWPDAHPDDNGIAPIQIIYAKKLPPDSLLHPGDWQEWVEHVTRTLDAKHSLLVTEIEPSPSLQETLILERDGIWYSSEWFSWRPDNTPQLSRPATSAFPAEAHYRQALAIAGQAHVEQWREAAMRRLD
ncbi:MAG: Shedu anti-phage system protein SduA domain-containing protein [Streptosporangiaceae bacterium]